LLVFVEYHYLELMKNYYSDNITNYTIQTLCSISFSISCFKSRTSVLVNDLGSCWTNLDFWRYFKKFINCLTNCSIRFTILDWNENENIIMFILDSCLPSVYYVVYLHLQSIVVCVPSYNHKPLVSI